MTAWRRCFGSRSPTRRSSAPRPVPQPSPWWRPFTRLEDVALVACLLTVHDVESWDVPPDTDSADVGMLDCVEYFPQERRVTARAVVGPGVVAVVSSLAVEVEISDRVAGLARVRHGLWAESERVLRLGHV